MAVGYLDGAVVGARRESEAAVGGEREAPDWLTVVGELQHQAPCTPGWKKYSFRRLQFSVLVLNLVNTLSAAAIWLDSLFAADINDSCVWTARAIMVK